MSGTPPTQETSSTPAVPGTAVIYICVERGKARSALSAHRAEVEGRSFANAQGLTVLSVITDPHGEPDPLNRAGWRRVRELVEAKATTTVIVRWPANISPDAHHEFRFREIRWLQSHGVKIRYSWEPLAASAGEIK